MDTQGNRKEAKQQQEMEKMRRQLDRQSKEIADLKENLTLYSRETDHYRTMYEKLWSVHQSTLPENRLN